MKLNEYKLEISLSLILFGIAIFFNFQNNLPLELKILSYIMGSLSIIPIMFMIFEAKYKSYYIESILKYKGLNNHIFEFLRLLLKSQELNNDVIKCTICMQDKFVINLLEKGEIKRWDAVDSMNETFWKTNKDNIFFNEVLVNSLGEKNIKRIKDKDKQYDFAIATLKDKSKIVFSEVLQADTRRAEIFFNIEDIKKYEARLKSLKNYNT